MAIVALVGSLLAASLAGCDPIPLGPIAFTDVAGNPIARLCVSATINEISLRQYTIAGDSEGTVVWEAIGHASVAAGTEIQLGGNIPGLSVWGDEFDINNLVGDFALHIEEQDSVGHSDEIIGSFTSKDLKEGKWLDAEGARTSKPCVSGACDPGVSCNQVWPNHQSATGLIPTAVPTPNGTPFPVTVPISFGLVGGEPVATVCIAADVGNLEVERARAPGQRTKGFQPAYGSFAATHIARGATIELGSYAPSSVGSSPTRTGPEPYLRGDFRVSMDVASASGMSATTGGTFRGSDLREGRWLNSSGKPEATACPG